MARQNDLEKYEIEGALCLWCGQFKPITTFQWLTGYPRQVCRHCRYMRTRIRKGENIQEEFMRKTKKMDELLRSFYKNVNAILARTYVVRGQDEEISELDALKMILALSREIDPDGIRWGARMKLPTIKK
jgi:hypothetical protein